jgi:SAM-dependent methyltransferase
MPEHMRSVFTMNNSVPVQNWYLNDVRPGGLLWTTRSRWWNPEKVQRRGVSYYGNTDASLYAALEDHPIKGCDVVIVGSEFPWYECIATTYGASVTTIEYRAVNCRIPGLCVLTPDAFFNNPRRFDAVISISSIEHDGLGRYGDRLDPNGDLRAMEQFRQLLKPQGKLFLAVPVGPDLVVWNAHRIYGPKRLAMLLSGWREVASYGFDRNTLVSGKLGDYANQPVFVLEPDEPVFAEKNHPTTISKPSAHLRMS